MRNAELRRALSNWDRLVKGSEGQLSYYIDRNLRLVEAFEKLDGMLEVAGIIYDFDRSSNLASAWAAAAQDPAFRNAGATALLIRDTYLVDNLSTLNAAMSQIIGLLEASIAD